MEAAVATLDVPLNARQTAARDTRERILRAAETVFASEGFAGASMRSIAEAAEVAPGLLHYHFDNKATLYAAIVGWRAGIINDERLRLLDALSASAGLLDVLRALFEPALGRDGGGAAYGRLMAAMMTGDAVQDALVREHYDPTAAIFIDAIVRVTGIKRVDAAWGYSFAIHVLGAGMARSGRTERLAGQGRPAASTEMLDRLVTFAAGGIEALDQP